MSYQEYLKTRHWQELRKVILKRDKYRCSKCKKGGFKDPEVEYIDIHHTVYRGRGKERLEDLEALCRACHKKEHGYE